MNDKPLKYLNAVNDVAQYPGARIDADGGHTSETAICPLLPYYCIFLSLKYAFGIISMFFTLVRCSFILLRLFLTYLHPCFLPYVQIHQNFVRLLMSHEKCPKVYYKIWDFHIFCSYCTVFSSRS